MIRSTTRLPDLDVAAALDKTADLARDTVYVMVGATVLTVQKLQVRRRELARALGQGGDLDERLSALEGKIDELVAEVRERLPEHAGAVVGQVHDAAKSARSQIRTIVTNVA